MAVPLAPISSRPCRTFAAQACRRPGVSLQHQCRREWTPEGWAWGGVVPPLAITHRSTATAAGAHPPGGEAHLAPASHFPRRPLVIPDESGLPRGYAFGSVRLAGVEAAGHRARPGPWTTTGAGVLRVLVAAGRDARELRTRRVSARGRRRPPRARTRLPSKEVTVHICHSPVRTASQHTHGRRIESGGGSRTSTRLDMIFELRQALRFARACARFRGRGRRHPRPRHRRQHRHLLRRARRPSAALAFQEPDRLVRLFESFRTGGERPSCRWLR